MAEVTEVCITIDTEFSIAGAFDDPEVNKPVSLPAVTGAADGRQWGLGFLLETLARYGARATFFVETANVCHFGLEAMGGIARRIAETGQDVQLHLHPCWHSFEGAAIKASGAWPPNDSCAGIGLETMIGYLRHGLATFEAWGLPRPVALRTGNLAVDRDVYRAQAAVGLPLASNIGLALSRPTNPGLRLHTGRHFFEGVLELPVLCFNDSSLLNYRRKRLMQVTAVGTRESMALLQKARAAGVKTVVILTHPFEFFKTKDMTFASLRANRINQRRLKALCAFIAARPDAYRFTTFAEGRERWLSAGAETDRQISSGVLWATLRTIENGLNGLVWQL